MEIRNSVGSFSWEVAKHTEGQSVSWDIIECNCGEVTDHIARVTSLENAYALCAVPMLYAACLNTLPDLRIIKTMIECLVNADIDDDPRFLIRIRYHIDEMQEALDSANCQDEPKDL